MIVLVHNDDMSSEPTLDGYVDTTIEIHIDDSLPLPKKRVIVLHELFDAMLYFCPHDMVDLMTKLTLQALDQIEPTNTVAKSPSNQ